MSQKNKQATPDLKRGGEIYARGRSSRSNESGRFEPYGRESFDDGWAAPEEDETERVDTTLTAENAKSILSRNESPDMVSTDRSILIAAVSTAASTVSRVRPMRISASRLASISRPSCSSSLRRRC